MVAEDGEAALSGAHSKIAGLSQQLMGSRDQLQSAQASLVTLPFLWRRGLLDSLIQEEGQGTS